MEDTVEKRFFGPLAGPERTHEPGTSRKNLPWAPVIVLLALTIVLLAVFLATILQTITTPDIRPPPVNYYSGADIIGLIATLVLFSILAWCYISVSLTDPGRVPKTWPWDPKQIDPRPDFEGEIETSKLNGNIIPNRIRGVERKLDGRTRFCKKCNMYKPDRAHHCKKLGRCVLEMDHWCPWVRNTIGYRNRKYFFLSVTYGWATLLSYCVVLGPYLSLAASLRDTLDFFTIFCWILASIEFFLLFALWSFHLFLTIHSFTTIEFREKHLAQDTKKARSGEKVSELYRKSLYDVGILSSFKHLLGPYPLLWLVPTRLGMSNDATSGLNFDVRSDHPLMRFAERLNSNSQDKPAKSAPDQLMSS